MTKGLPEKDKLRISQKTSSALFDGKADLPDEDVNSNQTATFGAGGWVTDLKTSEPDLNKISPVTDFSLSGTKLSGETPGQAATKQSSSLSASVSSAKSPADTAASAAENQPPAEAGKIAPFDLQRKCPKPCWCDKDLYADYTTDIKVCDSKCEILCEGYSTDGGAGGSTLGKLIKRFRDWMAGIYHWLKGDKKCGETWYNPDKQCCVNGTTIVTLCGGKCYDPVTEYCENDTICENTCSAGVISASPAPTNGEVETATLSVSGEKGDALGWSASRGTLTPSADKKQATITSMESGKVMVTFGSKNCSKCRTSITVAFVKVTSIKPDRMFTMVSPHKTVTFTVTTEPVGPVYMKLVNELFPEADPEVGEKAMPPLNSITLQSRWDDGTFIYKFDQTGRVRMRAKAGKYDKGIPSGSIEVLLF
ncbi:MAG: hypothetical protein HY796_02405 [Elusimicrobia bacterium]|nr:hypothetical protein [Elusimicrobiota bacterium]